MRIHLLTALICIILFSACKKNNGSTNNPTPPPTNPTYELGPRTKVVDNTTSQTIQSVDSTKVIFTGNTSQLQGLSKDDIIISGSAPNAKYGFLRKITSVQKNGNTYTFSTTEVPLTDAFKELHVDYTKAYSVADTGGRLTGTSFTVDMPDLVLYDGDNNNSTTYDQVKLNGSFEVSPELHVKIDISNFSLKYAKIDGGFNEKLTATLTAGGNIASMSKKLNLFSKPLAYFVIPGTPLVIVPNLRVSLGADASFNVSVSASNTTTASVNSYIEYQNGSWDKGYTQTMDNQFNFSGIHGTANAKVYLEPAIDFKLYNSDWAKGSLLAQAYLKASGQISPTVDCELRAGVSAGAEANLQFFGWNFAAVSYPSIFDYSKQLYSCSTAGVQLPTVTTSSIISVQVNSATSGGNILSDGNSPVTVRGICWSISPNPTTANSKTTDGAGVGNFISIMNGLSPNTKYYVRAYATNSVGTEYGNEVSFTTQSSTLPTITTSNVTVLTSTTAQGGGSITSDGGSAITVRGVCWSTSHDPTISNNKTSDGTGTGTFTSSLIGLAASTTYYARGYATNSAGTAYGNEVSFSTDTAASNNILFNPNLTYGTLTDIDGNVYKTITIGNQTWMAENLKVTHYRNGDPIPNVTGSTAWYNLTSGAYCDYNNDASNSAIYGHLYTWFAATDNRNIAPAGWHIPNDLDWNTLVGYLGGGDEANKMKESGLVHWKPSNASTNSSGFTALPGGYRVGYNGSAYTVFGYINTYGVYWSSSVSTFDSNQGSCRYFDSRSTVTWTSGFKMHGFSIKRLGKYSDTLLGSYNTMKRTIIYTSSLERLFRVFL